jgi:hypothetical protein
MLTITKSNHNHNKDELNTGNYPTQPEHSYIRTRSFHIPRAELHSYQGKAICIIAI